jgi:cold shock CspA family protein
VNGKITEFSRKGSSGAIQSDDGEHLHFDVTAVLAYDVAALAPGQIVSFEPDGGSPPKAINVSVLPPASIHYSDDRYREMRRIRYVGFDQQKNIRTYRFERFSPGELTEHFLVDTDMVLFGQNKVKLQEGPALCLHLLAHALGPEPAIPQNPYSVTAQHMLAFLASEGEPGGKPRSRSYLRS